MTTSSIDAELAAIRTSAAIYPLTGQRAFLRITGSDATRWLNGMVTNNIAALAPGEGNYNFLLNAQGRIQGDCTIYREPADGPATYLLETDASQLETIQKHLEHFIIMDDVELAPALTDKFGWLVLGPTALANLDAALVWPADPIALVYGAGPADPLAISSGRNQFEIWGDESTGAWLRRVFDKTVPEISPQTLEAHRILSAVPKFGVDITEKILPQETGQTRALHFSKGCYLGQEIVERIHSRGQVHRIFTQFTLTGEMPTLPAPLESNSKPAGELTSAALIDGTLYALGYARRELLQTAQATHQPFIYSGGVATPSAPPKLTT